MHSAGRLGALGVDGPEAVAPALFELATQLKAPTSLADLGLELDAIEGSPRPSPEPRSPTPGTSPRRMSSYLVRQAYLGKSTAAREELIIMTQVSPHGLHHVTAIATDPQSNVDFYTRALGLRLVKQTVNFDAPDTYHLYYGDETGQPVESADLLSVAGRAAGSPGCRNDDGDGIQRAGILARLVA